jgi:hypothetical protein
MHVAFSPTSDMLRAAGADGLGQTLKFLLAFSQSSNAQVQKKQTLAASKERGLLIQEVYTH